MPEATFLLELGVVILVLSLLARLAGRLGLSAIPVYLLAGLGVGEGGVVPLVTAEEFISIGAEIGGGEKRSGADRLRPGSAQSCAVAGSAEWRLRRSVDRPETFQRGAVGAFA